MTAHRDLAGALRPQPGPRLRQGTVQTVNGDGTIDVAGMGGSATVIPSVPYLGAVIKGAGVWLIQQDRDLLALGSTSAPQGLRQIVTFTGSGTFTKAAYPWLRALRIRVQAGGGGAGSAVSTTAGFVSWGGGGGGGGYAEAFLDVATLAASETVTVGGGGAGGTGGSNGSSGSGSSLGSHAAATGGAGGLAVGAAGTGTQRTILAGGAGGVGTAGDLLSRGGNAPHLAQTAGGSLGSDMRGGDSMLSHGPSMQLENNGLAGLLGAGGSGMRNSNSGVTRTGGAGGPGVVIVELFG